MNPYQSIIKALEHCVAGKQFDLAGKCPEAECALWCVHPQDGGCCCLKCINRMLDTAAKLLRHADITEQANVDEIVHLQAQVDNLTLYLSKAFEFANWLEPFMRTNFSGLPGYTANTKLRNEENE